MAIEFEEIGRIIGRLRKRRGLTQQTVAEKIGVSVNFLSLLENGQRGATIETLNSIADALGIPAEFLIFLGSSGGLAEFRQLIDATKETIVAAIDLDGE